MGSAIVSGAPDGGGRAYRKHKRDTFHAWMLEGLEFSPAWELPKLAAVDAHPKGLVPFSAAMGADCDDFDCFVHFYEDDFRFERVWNEPRKYLPRRTSPPASTSRSR